MAFVVEKASALPSLPIVFGCRDHKTHPPGIMKKAQARKTVTISDVSYIRTTVVDALPEAEATWYTHAEMTQKQLETSREVLRLSRLLMSAAPESFTTDQQLQCLGIETHRPCYCDPCSTGTKKSSGTDYSGSARSYR
eukprot:scaffold14886_cov81-Skeletonema_marinoi.AAC.2